MPSENMELRESSVLISWVPIRLWIPNMKVVDEINEGPMK